MTDDVAETDSQKRPEIHLDSPYFGLSVVGSEGESLEDVEDTFSRQFEESIDKVKEFAVKEFAEEVQDKTFQ